MPDAFISHTSSDDAFVARLAAALESAGVTPWVDGLRIVPGDDFVRRIQDALAGAAYVIVVLSPDSLLSDWVREESNAALLDAVHGTTRLIPVLHGAITPGAMPPLLRLRQPVDFRPPADFDRAMAQLLSAFEAPPPRQPASLRVADVQIARHADDGTVALEVLLANDARHGANVVRLGIDSRAPFHTHYLFPPPTWVYPMGLTVGPGSTDGITALGGSIGDASEPWRRAVAGRLVISPYRTALGMDLPVRLALGAHETGWLRITFDSFRAGRERYEARRAETALYASAESGAEHAFDRGTRVLVREADGTTASFLAADALIETIGPLIATPQHDELRLELARRRPETP